MMKDLVVCRGISVSVTANDSAWHDAAAVEKALKKLRAAFGKTVNADVCRIYKKSVDARRRDAIRLLYSVCVPADVCHAGRSLPEGMERLSLPQPRFDPTPSVSHRRPVVVGFGPCGLFCALALAKAGLRPIVLERGQCVSARREIVRRYFTTGQLDPTCNVQFGEGGAGLFSDGKLLTRISDPLSSYVLGTFVEYGAPKEIVYLAKPHIGTDNLYAVVEKMRTDIEKCGGEVRFGETFCGFERAGDGHITAVVTEKSGIIPCDDVFLCVGHSARDTFRMLAEKGVTLEKKDFSVGFRIEHLQSDIDAALYGRFAGSPALGHAAYTLAEKNGDTAVYSFCMCPGGTVVASASAAGEIVTNGMSEYARGNQNANAAIAVSVKASSLGEGLFAGMDFQKRLESNAYTYASGAAPIQTLGDYLAGTLKHEPSRIQPSYTGQTALRDLNTLFPKEINDAMRFGFDRFEKRINGFCAPDAVLTAPETRTSSPVRIPRDASYRARGIQNLYVLGEGAGYAGGITSAAVDGLRAALAYIGQTE